MKSLIDQTAMTAIKFRKRHFFCLAETTYIDKSGSEKTKKTGMILTFQDPPAVDTLMSTLEKSLKIKVSDIWKLSQEMGTPIDTTILDVKEVTGLQ
jgi:hypothetical protein